MKEKKKSKKTEIRKRFGEREIIVITVGMFSGILFQLFYEKVDFINHVKV